MVTGHEPHFAKIGLLFIFRFAEPNPYLHILSDVCFFSHVFHLITSTPFSSFFLAHSQTTSNWFLDSSGCYPAVAACSETCSLKSSSPETLKLVRSHPPDYCFFSCYSRIPSAIHFLLCYLSQFETCTYSCSTVLYLGRFSKNYEAGKWQLGKGLGQKLITTSYHTLSFISFVRVENVSFGYMNAEYPLDLYSHVGVLRQGLNDELYCFEVQHDGGRRYNVKDNSALHETFPAFIVSTK